MLEASGMVVRKEPFDLRTEAVLFIFLGLYAERKFYTPKPVDDSFPLLASRSLKVLNRSPDLVTVKTVINDVKVDVGLQAQNRMRNIAASAVRCCKATSRPAPTSLLIEMRAILEDKKRERPSFHRFMALWVLATSARYELPQPRAAMLQWMDDLIYLGPTAKAESTGEFPQQVKPIVDEMMAFKKTLI
jgi:hypothetical protein